MGFVVTAGLPGMNSTRFGFRTTRRPVTSTPQSFTPRRTLSVSEGPYPRALSRATCERSRLRYAAPLQGPGREHPATVGASTPAADRRKNPRRSSMGVDSERPETSGHREQRHGVHAGATRETVASPAPRQAIDEIVSRPPVKGVAYRRPREGHPGRVLVELPC